MAKENTTDVINKLETKIPSFAQNYSDLYNAYFHMIDDIYGAFCMSEKEFVDKMNIDSKTMNELKSFFEKVKDQQINNIEMIATLCDEYVKMRIFMIKSFDKYAHVWMELYGKMLTQFNKSIK
jgi:hypothetical protein